ncbi:acyl-CoA thioesterase [Allopseudospirillum japonicum]|uniref:Acyl-CoA thioesterase n=1 Tax=Allopseudospirillum japonicum TaxID=64971 RepID=A0A1H6T0B9_9GAMM|nr:hydroxyphenylacetyl-CoA thioesterase PaaI [Allopseudospirillum japonicum]SEI70527.1 acyl-CoA thioesterase [Allopseudospirillum japonicum]
MNKVPQDPQALAQACAQAMFARDQASQTLGMQIVKIAPGFARLQMSVSDTMIQGHQSCHGGYIFALADSTFAFACNTYNVVTVASGCSIEYIAPAKLGDVLTATAEEKARKGRTGTYDVRIENQNGQLIALFRGKSYSVRGTLLAEETPA